MSVSPPSSRRAILILEEHDIDRCEIAGDTKFLYNDEILILPLPLQESKQSDNAIQNIISANLLRPGTVLIQNPYETDIYSTPDEAMTSFPLHKYLLFSCFCQALGARNVEIEEIDVSSQSGAIKFSASGEKLAATGNLNVDYQQFEKVQANLSLNDTFSGGEPDLIAAESLLVGAQLISDPNMRTLLNACKIRNNKITSRTLLIDLTKETKTNLQIAGEINIPATIKLNTEFAHLYETINQYKLKVRVDF